MTLATDEPIRCSVTGCDQPAWGITTGGRIVCGDCFDYIESVNNGITNPTPILDRMRTRMIRWFT